MGTEAIWQVERGSRTADRRTQNSLCGKVRSSEGLHEDFPAMQKPSNSDLNRGTPPPSSVSRTAPEDCHLSTQNSHSITAQYRAGPARHRAEPLGPRAAAGARANRRRATLYPLTAVLGFRSLGHAVISGSCELKRSGRGSEAVGEPIVEPRTACAGR